jgi:GntR family transcriptional regulator
MAAKAKPLAGTEFAQASCSFETFARCDRAWSKLISKPECALMKGGNGRAAPRYRSIAEVLRRQIRSGTYEVGAKLPTEERLCSMFGASRQTLREALRALTDEGLIVRRPRAGSLVVARESPTGFVQRVGSIEELLNYPTQTYRRTIETKHVEVDDELAPLLKCEPGSARFLITALRLPKGSDIPLCWTDIYIMPEYASVISHPKHHTVTVADQITEMFGEIAVRTDIEISAGQIPAKMAKPLGVIGGSPSLNVVRRCTGANGVAFETTISVHPGARYIYTFELRREKQPVKIADEPRRENA